MTDLGDADGRGSSAQDVNDNGQVVGGTWVPNFYQYAFIDSNGVMNYSIASGAQSLATGINNNGDVVGYYSLVGGDRAFIYSAGVATDLNSLIGGAGWLLNQA